MEINGEQCKFVKLLDKTGESTTDETGLYFFNVKVKGVWQKEYFNRMLIASLIDSGHLYEQPSRWNAEHKVVTFNAADPDKTLELQTAVKNFGKERQPTPPQLAILIALAYPETTINQEWHNKYRLERKNGKSLTRDESDMHQSTLKAVVTSDWVEGKAPEGKPNRKNYTLTAKGIAVVNAHWNTFGDEKGGTETVEAYRARITEELRLEADAKAAKLLSTEVDVEMIERRGRYHGEVFVGYLLTMGALPGRNVEVADVETYADKRTHIEARVYINYANMAPAEIANYCKLLEKAQEIAIKRQTFWDALALANK